MPTTSIPVAVMGAGAGSLLMINIKTTPMTEWIIATGSFFCAFDIKNLLTLQLCVCKVS